MKSRLPGKRYDIYKIEGRDIEIRISNRAEDGPFFALVENEWHRGNDVDNLLREIRKSLVVTLAYRPIIRIGIPRFRNRGNDIFNLRIERLFEADHPYRGKLYFQFVHPENTFTYDDDLEGTHGSETTPDTDSESCSTFNYTPEKWSRLMMIKKQYHEMKNKVEEILSSDKAEPFLLSASLRLIEQQQSETKPTINEA